MFGHSADLARLRARKEAALQRTRASRASGAGSGWKRGRKVQVVAAVAATVGILATGLVTGSGSPASAGTVGSGFTVTASDLAFILKQIKIAERHVRSIDGTQPDQAANPHLDPTDPLYDPQYCTSLVGPNTDQIPDPLTSYGLRLVDGGCNNLVKAIQGVNGDPATPGVIRPNFARADQPFPRLTDPLFRDAEGTVDDQLGTGVAGVPSSTYNTNSRSENVYDSQPRVISNLIIDQTSDNPAAIVAAGHPVRSQDPLSSAVPCHKAADGTDIPDNPPGCIPSHQTLFIPNVTTDVGLSPPYNAFFTFFGQFFDHGVDQTVKSGAQVVIPLRADDPLVTNGPDGIAGNSDDVTDPAKQFMTLPRAQNQPGPDGVLGTADDVQNANNTDTPWVDQSQTYTSHPAHQVFLREYQLGTDNLPHATGKFLDGLPAGQTYPGSPDGAGSIGTWKATKLQAASMLGLLLEDKEVGNVPMVAADPYGNFIPGPHGLPQWVTGPDGIDGIHGNADDGVTMVEGDRNTPVPAPPGVAHFDTPFLTDVNGLADPGTVGPCVGSPAPANCKSPDTNTTVDITMPTAAGGPDATHYDDELLNSHFICGDGRCNENIALSTVHQIFHSEHNRLVDDESDTLNAAGNESLKADYLATNCASADCTTHDPNQPQTFTNGERMFQAARFVTEMEYQHLVFEEFARKIQPAVRPFHVYNADINSAIPAEYAHAVYRFGHSMLNDTVDRQTRDSHNVLTDTSVPLLTAFLNPPLFFNNFTTTSSYTARQAAGAVVMGTADQTGNELDEFVAQTLRNNLLGQPLDLPTLNIARGRDTGIPPLNVLRRQIFAATNDGQLAPYTSWSDYGQHLKHPESLINFVAAYGTHPTIRDSGPDGVLGNGDDVTTIAAKRAAARAIVDPQSGDVPPPDASAFMFSTNYPGGVDPGPDGIVGTDCGTPDATSECADNGVFPPVDWSNNADGSTITGLDSVDVWVGGLAEVTDLFGGLLGTTMNYVFEHALENLQDGDRLYYLARTPGMNLRTQLEGNSFAEMIMRNTDGTNSLKADAFSTADCKFQLAHLKGTAAAFNTVGSIVADDTTTECKENLVLQRKPDGTIQYKQVNTVDPSGINGQSVYNGSDGPNGPDNQAGTADDGTNQSTDNPSGDDRVFGGNDNDTFWGGTGNDIIDGGSGDDVILGGFGNDIETDQGGADVLKGGPGNDALDGGIGDDIFMGGDGQDVINGGANDNEVFAGPGTDFVIAGQGADAVFGDGGDDWIQGGSGQDLLQGDHGAPFFDDPAQTAPGNDVFVGQVGENDYDTEGGDDLMAQNAAIDRNAGAGGFDWAFHQYDTVGADDDMLINQMLVGLPIQLVVNRDRWQETEADSGSPFNDVMHGDALERVVGPGGFSGCDALDPTGVARIKNLNRLVTSFPSSLADIFTASINGYCPLVGQGSTGLGTGTVWAEGNILLGGLGSDLIEGRDNDDIIDGDHALTVALGVRNPSTGLEIGRTDLLEHVPTSVGGVAAGSFSVNPADTAGMTLQQAVFAGKVDPGNIFPIREIGMQDTATTATPNVTSRASDCKTATNHDLIVTNLQGQTTVVQGSGRYLDLAATSNCDTAEFLQEPLAAPAFDPLSQYTVTQNPNGSITVRDLTSVAAGPPFPKGDGENDTLWNMENLRFCTGNDAVTKACNAFVDMPVGPSAFAAPLAFGPVTLNTNTTRPITVTNIGLRSLVLSSPTPVTLGAGSNAAFTIVPTGTTCTAGRTLARNATCIVNIRFAPTTTTPVTATVNVSSNGPLLTVAVTGKGSAPVASVSPTSLTFAKQTINTNSAIQTVTVSNTGDVPLAIASGGIVVGPAGSGFTRVAGTCNAPGNVAAGGNCTITVRFNPSTVGVKTGSLTITDNSNAVPGSVQTVQLSGEGAVPVASLNTTTLAFGNVQVGSAPPTQDVILTNTGGGATNLTVSVAVTAGQGFARVAPPTGNCGASLASGASCTIRIRFTPAGGAASGTVTITTNSNLVPGSQQTVSLSGTGTITAVNDTSTALASNSVNPVNNTISVRANDLPANTGTVTITNSTVSNGGASATVLVNANNQVVWTTSASGTAAARQAARRGTYTVTYTLTIGGATSSATATLTLT